MNCLSSPLPFLLQRMFRLKRTEANYFLPYDQEIVVHRSKVKVKIKSMPDYPYLSFILQPPCRKTFRSQLHEKITESLTPGAIKSLRIMHSHLCMYLTYINIILLFQLHNFMTKILCVQWLLFGIVNSSVKGSALFHQCQFLFLNVAVLYLK